MRKRKVLFLGRPYALAANVILLLAALTFNTSAAWQIAIDGPTEVRAGELVILSVELEVRSEKLEVRSEETGDDFSSTSHSSLLTPHYAWQVTPPELVEGKYRVCDGGRTLVFASREVGCYHFILAASDGETLQMVTHTLFNLGEQHKPIPLPPPDPEPQPQPQPEPPREFQSLTDWAAQKTASLVTSEFFVREKAALVEALTEITTRIRHGEIKTAERARVEMRVITRKKLDAISRRTTAAWLAWETELARQLTQLEREGKLDTLEQVRQAFDAIADGLIACEPISKSQQPPQGGR